MMREINHKKKSTLFVPLCPGVSPIVLYWDELTQYKTIGLTPEIIYKTIGLTLEII